MKVLHFFYRLAAISALMLYAVGLHSQSIYYVNGSVLPGGNGQSWGAAFNNLQVAMDSACINTPAEIWVVAGTYYPIQNADTTSTSPTDRTNTFLLCNGVAVYGGFAGDENELEDRDWVTNLTILSGDLDKDDTLAFNTYNVVTCTNTDSTAELDGFTITGGNANDQESEIPHASGGGVYNVNSSPTIRYCILSGNAALFGAGMYNDSASPTLIQCSISDNTTVGNFGRGAGMANSHAYPKLIDCTINNNNATSFGGGIYNVGESAATLINCAFTNNSAKRGGGLYSNFSSSAMLTGCSFIGNFAEDEGGGMYSNDNSSSVLINCSFIDNETEAYGGGMHNTLSSQSRLTNCLFRGNKAYIGGGMYNVNGSSVVLIHTALSGNEAEADGAGIYNYQSLLSLTNCTLSGNLAGENGGGIKNEDSSLKLINCTVSGNSAVEDGGGLHNRTTSDPFITNSIFWNNQAFGSILTSTASIYNENSSSPDISYCLIANSGGSNNWDNTLGTDQGNNIDSDPLFVADVDLIQLPNTSGDLHLQSGSPAINAGTLDTTRLMIASIDLDGNPRFVHGRIDMGAYEFQGNITLPACNIAGPNSVISFSTNMFTGPNGMTTYTWSIEGNAKIISSGDEQAITIEAGAINSYLLTLTITDMDGIISTCALKVHIEVDCALYTSAQVIYVNAAATGANKGTSWIDAFVELQDAMQLNCPGITGIWVAAGTYYPTSISHDRDATFQLENGIALYGGFAGDEDELTDRDFVANLTMLTGDIDRDGALAGNVYNIVTGSGTDSTSILDGFTITGGNADVFSGGYYPYSAGAGLFIISGSPAILNCIITGNLAGWGAGCMNHNSSPIMTNCTFSDNLTSMGGSGGGMFNGNNSSPVLTDCTFNNNTCNRLGGGMCNENASPILINCTFNENEVSSNSGRGGGMYNNESSPVISHCIFRNNLVSGNGLGGGMCNQTNSSPTMTHSTFENNLAKRGSGMYNQNNSSPVLTDCIFSDNETRFEGIGGGMYNLNGSAPLLTRCTFSDNFGYDYGGGMHNEDASPVLDQCTFLRNETYEYGGAGISNDHSSPTLTACLFDSNISYLYGGGIYGINGSSVAMTQCVFTGNSAIDGGGIYMEDDSVSIIDNCIFNRNIALGSGGGMEIFNSSPTLINCAFAHNTAGYDAGGIYILNNSHTTMINTILMSNSATENGGGIFNISNDPITLTNCTISGNTAGLDGGAIYNDGYSLAKLKNCILWNNSAHKRIDTSSASIFIDSSSTAEISYSLIANSGGSEHWNLQIGIDQGHNLDDDPLFVEDVDLDMLPDSTGDLRLRNGSPAINAGTPDTTGLMIPSSDPDGNPRIVNGRVDMGAFEYQGIVSIPPMDDGHINMLIYPNPADETIYILGHSKAGDVMITNILGQMVSLHRGIQPDIVKGYPIDISHLMQGVYVVHFNSGKVVESAKKITIIRR